MSELMQVARELCDFLLLMPEVRDCQIYGSLERGDFDDYSDIDIRVDVSGSDNGRFAQNLPARFSEQYTVIFADYAPSLVPGKYILSIAFDEEAPFRVVDIDCYADPHCKSVSREEVAGWNDLYDHTLKLFSANLKHYLRGNDCYTDVLKMYGRIFGQSEEERSEKQMLHAVFAWLELHAQERHENYVAALEQYLF